jgi:hypothetical protein
MDDRNGEQKIRIIIGMSNPMPWLYCDIVQLLMFNVVHTKLLANRLGSELISISCADIMVQVFRRHEIRTLEVEFLRVY